MGDYAKIEVLLEQLREFGIRTIEDRRKDGGQGFPLSMPIEGGGSLVLDLPNPGFLASLDPEGIGVAILDPLGYPKATWGLARRIAYFKAHSSVLESPIGALLEGSYQGSHGALYLDGYRYFSSGMAIEGTSDVFVLIVNALEEKTAKKQASKSWRTANALKRLGKALSMNQNMLPMCVAAAHEIASATELAAVLLWTVNPEDSALKLAASVGANRLGSQALNWLACESHSPGCAAELVSATRQPFNVSNVSSHVLTSNLEAKFCYLKPGGMSVHPLVISDKLLGVLELVGREDDQHFEENEELFVTVAEHLALTLNGAMLFENFERLASHDALTGLSNHRSLHEFLHQRMSEAERTGQGLGLIMLDVDHFRSFNEEEGHDAGDEVLKLVAEAIKGCLRPYDMAARYGGEEFTVIMPGSGPDGTLSVAERIRQKVEDSPFVTRSGRMTHVTVSLGCATYPHTSSEGSALLKAADNALYEAKRGGRNRVVMSDGGYEPSPRRNVVSLDALKGWVHPIEWKESEARLERLRKELEWLSESLRLSESQRSILEALILIAPTYQRAAQCDDRVELEAMESASEFRLLLPSLMRLGERYDGQGPKPMGNAKIPLLARALDVLLALDVDGGRSLILDSGRYDPEIVTMLERYGEAA